MRDYGIKKKLHKITAWALLVCLLVSCALPAGVFASESEDTTRTLRVGFFQFDGYHSMDEDGNRSGYGYDLLQLIARYANVTYEYVGYDKSWSEMQTMLENGEIDLLTSARKTEEREKIFDFSDKNIGTTSTMLTVKAGNRSIVAGDFSTWQGMKVGELEGNSRNKSFAFYAQRNGITYKPFYYKNQEELREALQSGEIDAAVTSRLRNVHGEWVLTTFDEEPIYAITRKGDKETMNLVNEALDAIDRNEPGWRQELTDKYYSEDSGDEIYLTSEEEEYLSKIKEDGTVFKVLVNSDRYPYSFLGSDGNLTGIMPDVFSELASRAGISYEIIKTTSREEYVEAVSSGVADICMDMHDDFSTAEGYGYKITDVYLSAPFSWVLLKGFSGQPKIVGTIGASAAKSTTPDNPDADVTYLYYNSYDDCMKALRSGEIEGFYTYTYQAEKLVFEDVYDDIKTRLSNMTTYFTVGVRSDLDVRLLDILSKAVNSLDDSTVDNITDQYTNLGRQKFSVVRFSHQYPTMLALIALCVLFIVLFLIWIARARHYQHQAEMALRRAEAANRSKTEFLSNMSHDIRTPINGIMGMLEIAQKNPTDTERVEDCLEKMHGAAEHLLSLINDVLDMSKVEAGAVNLLDEPFDLRNLLDDCCGIIDGQLERRDLEFTTDLGPFEHPYVRGSELHIRQILINILGNAVKYTKDGGSIRFAVKETEYRDGKVSLCMTVADTGIGMTEEFQQHIFEPFTQGRHDSRSDYRGTGLGMAISKRLTEQMNGDLTVESELGKGSVFTLTLTLAEGERPETEPLPGKVSLNGLQILLAEDNELNREIATALLEEEGCVVKAAVNGREALEIFKENGEGAFDVVLLDVMMPEMDGLETARQIRAFEGKTPEEGIPIIAMTANVFAEDVRACLDAGMNSHIGKPIEMEKLAAEIARLTKMRK